jgi:hypothetical protein
MGTGEKRSGMKHRKNGPKITLALFLGIAIGLAGCQSQATPTPMHAEPSEEPAPSTLLPTTTTIPSTTPTPTPTLTATPTIGPEITLTQTHPTVSYSIPLTIQRLTESEAVLYFVLDHSAEGYLFYGSTSAGSFTNAERLDGSQLTHLITLTNLEAGRNYQAAVGLLTEGGYMSPGLDEGLWDPIQFRTPVEGSWPIRVGVIGDSGFGEQLTFNLASQMVEIELDFVLHTGDVVYKVEDNVDAAEAYQEKYYLPFSTLLHKMPILAVPGNHEYDTAAEVKQVPYYYLAFPQVPGWTPQSELNLRQYYSYEVGYVQFLFLDSQVFWRGQGAEEQSRWLEERLSDNRFSISIPVVHVPPFSSGLHPTDGIPLERTWVPLFEKYHVPLVLSGHDHNYQRLVVGRTTYVVSGGGSGVIYPMSDPHPAGVSFSAKSHFLLLTLHPNFLELDAVAMDGEILDEVVIEIGDIDR